MSIGKPLRAGKASSAISELRPIAADGPALAPRRGKQQRQNQPPEPTPNDSEISWHSMSRNASSFESIGFFDRPFGGFRQWQAPRFAVKHSLTPVPE
ncbi:hypothetical protein ACTXGQ_15050 [Marinobacter sp. 1Y8]